MKKLRRLALSQRTRRVLDRRTERVAQASDPKAEAARLWRQKKVKAFQEIRATLEKMAPGLQHCMYCESNEGTDIEHFWPKSRYPHRAFDWANFLLACPRCNSNYKRNQFPLDEERNPLLLDPTVDEPHEHLEFLPSTGRYMSLTGKGNHSIRVFGLDRGTLERGRRNAWVALQALIIDYARTTTSGDHDWANDIRRTVCEHPFASVLDRLLRLAEKPAGRRFVQSECLDVLDRHAEIKGWI